MERQQGQRVCWDLKMVQQREQHWLLLLRLHARVLEVRIRHGHRELVR
jgi:hypothetical protein